MNEEKDFIYSDTAYDDAFRTMEGECDDLVIGFVNHMFDEKYELLRNSEKEEMDKG